MGAETHIPLELDIHLLDKKAPAAQPKGQAPVVVRIVCLKMQTEGVVLRLSPTDNPAQRATSTCRLFSVASAIIQSSYTVPYSDGLVTYHQRHWRRLREDKEKEFETVYAPIIYVLGMTQKPVTIEQIAAWTNLSYEQVKDSIGLWRKFLKEELVEGEHRYRIYHVSFQDFLKEQVDLVRFDDMIANYYLSLAGLEQ